MTANYTSPVGRRKKKKMACYFPLEIMLCILCMLHPMLYNMACGCIAEERIALMHLRSSLLQASRAGHVAVPPWEQSGDCCSWSYVSCDGNGRVSGLRLSASYYLEDPIAGRECWNLSMTVFSPLHELCLLDLSWNSACLQNLDGMLLPSTPKHCYCMPLICRHVNQRLESCKVKPFEIKFN